MIQALYPDLTHCTIDTIYLLSKMQWAQSLLKRIISVAEDFEILHEIVRDITRKSEKHELIRVESRTISCCISESPLHFISFLTVWTLHAKETKPNQTSRILRILLTSTILCRIERDPDIERLASEARRLSMGVMQDRRGSLATDNQVHNNLQAFWLHRISGLVLWYPVYSRIPDLTAGYPAAAGNRGYQISEKAR